MDADKCKGFWNKSRCRHKRHVFFLTGRIHLIDLQAPSVYMLCLMCVIYFKLQTTKHSSAMMFYIWALFSKNPVLILRQTVIRPLLKLNGCMKHCCYFKKAKLIDFFLMEVFLYSIHSIHSCWLHIQHPPHPWSWLQDWLLIIQQQGSMLCKGNLLSIN